jgi:hypothetical protein
VSRAHLFADGGGRELAYVAMSRARESANAWVVADDVEQAAEDLRRDWSSDRTQIWAIDTGLPEYDKLSRDTIADMVEAQKVRRAAIALSRAKITAKGINRIESADLASTLADARAVLHRTRQARADLDTGLGVYEHTDAGRAVSDLVQAQAALPAARWRAEHGSRWRARHAAAKEATSWAEREAGAQRRFQSHVAPEAARLNNEITRHQAAVEQLASRFERQRVASALTGETSRNLHRTISRLTAGLDTHRDRLDGISRTPRQPAPRSAGQVRVFDPTPQQEAVTRPDLGPQM